MPGEQTTVRALPGPPIFFDGAGALLPAATGIAAAARKESAYG